MYLSYTLSENQEPEVLHLRDVLEEVLLEYRITLRKYDIEVLYGPLQEIRGHFERIFHFLKRAICNVIQCSRDSRSTIVIDGFKDEGAYLLRVAARQKGQITYILEGRF